MTTKRSLQGHSSDNFETVKLGDIVSNVKQKVDPITSGLEYYVSGGGISSTDLRISEWGSIGDGVMGPAFHMKFEAGQVLYKSRVPHGVAVADRSGICANTTFVLDAKKDKFLPGLLPFLLLTSRFRQFEDSNNRGSTNLFLNFSDIARFEFTLPSLTEQERILTLLTACEDSLRKIRIAIDRCTALRKSTIFFLYQYGTRNESRVPTPIGDLPKSWTVTRLGDRYEIQLGKMLSEKARSLDNSTPYLRNANVQWNRLDLSDVAVMSFSDVEKNKFSLRYGDILACEGRHVGKAAMWRDEIPGACYQKALHRLRVIYEKDHPEFLLHCLQYYSWCGRFIALTGETTIPHLPAERFREISFPFPCKEEQVEIATVIRDIDEQIVQLRSRESIAQKTLVRAIDETLGGIRV